MLSVSKAVAVDVLAGLIWANNVEDACIVQISKLRSFVGGFVSCRPSCPSLLSISL